MRIGIVDTTFSRIDMGAIAIDEIRKHLPNMDIERRTVPGIKDLPVECKRLLESGGPMQGAAGGVPGSGCDICMALGMVGGAPIDTQCGHEASLGMQQAMLMTNKHVIEVFVHENEAWSEEEFRSICENRIRKHAQNAIAMMLKPEALVKYAGQGLRQGKESEGPIGAQKKLRLGIVVGQFNSEITSKMKARAQAVAAGEGAETLAIEVPGVYDMPLVVKKMLMDKNIDAVVTLGAVVKGETAHDEVITKDTARRLGDLSLEFRKPVTLGIIGHDVTWEKAQGRADDYSERATKAAIHLVKMLRQGSG
ncbi:MAG: riboflavin synthase [Candidatus Micrarchaeota archaeon]